jgi:glycosyltransferase involved in cell wall biosynthesis
VPFGDPVTRQAATRIQFADKNPSGFPFFLMPDDNTEQKPKLPAVSVIIPAYNTAGYIGVALASVFGQSYTDFEVIVINDGSEDSNRLELAIGPYLPRIIYLKQQNRGPSAARNLGIQHARGEYLAFLDSDDSWLPEYLTEQIEFLRSEPSLDMVYSDALFLGNRASAGKTFMELCPSNGPVTFESLLLEETQVITSGTVAGRQRVVEAGLFDENFLCAEDHDLWLRIAHLGGKIAYQRKVLAKHLVRPDSQGSPPGKLVAGEIEVLRKLDRELDLPPRTRLLLAAKLRTAQARLASIRGRRYLLTGEYDKAYEFLDQANTLAPNAKLGAILIGLRTVPRLTGFGARIWDRLLSQ